MRAKIILVIGVVCTVGGIVGLILACPREVPVSQGWDYIPFNFGYPIDYHFKEAWSWGAWALAFFITALAGGVLTAAGISLLRPRAAMIIGICGVVLGILLLGTPWPNLEPIAHFRGHAMTQVLSSAMRKDLGMFYAAEIVFLMGVLVIIEGAFIALARKLRRRLAT